MTKPLKACMPEQESRQIVLGNYASLVQDTGGRNPPFILIHALGTNQHMWDEVVPLIADQRRVITYDVRGHGSAAGAPLPFSMSIFSSDLKTLMEALDIKKAHIVGLSMGGAIAQTFTLDHPERVVSLSLVATVSQVQDSFVQRARSTRKVGMQAQIEPTLTRWFSSEMLATNGSQVQFARKAIQQQSISEWEASWLSMAGLAVYARLQTIMVPTKVIAGGLDVSCPPLLMKHDIAQRIPGAVMFVIPGATHMVSLTKPAELAAILLNQCTS